MGENQIRVEVKIYSWYSGALVSGLDAALLLEEELPPGSSLRACLTRLGARFARFEEIIYDSHQDILQLHVTLTHNGKLLTGSDRMNQVLQNGDSICLIPAYAGG